MHPDSAPADSAAKLPAGKRRARGPRWERRKDSRPSELLDAALEIFVERGYAAARLEDVASKAGVSKGTLYLYYDNKEELFKAVVRRRSRRCSARTREMIEQSDKDSETLLAQFLHTWWTATAAPGSRASPSS